MSSITARRLPGPATLEDLLAIPENERRHELIDGVLIETNTLRPDIAGWRRERLAELPSEVPIRLRPDWTCEVLSSNHRNDLVKKKRLYHQHQVPHYWIADPVEQTLAVSRWSPDGYVEVLTTERGERVRAEPFEAIELVVGVLFGDDDDE